jgi:peptidyl-prolyl cis-trans isomerase A (cyclophilin A)
VKLETALGAIILRLEGGKAPATVKNFLRYVDQKRLDGTSFYRAMKVGDAGSFGLIQGGVRGDPKRALPPVLHEPTSKTGLSNTDGVISMARAAPGTATGDFFIILGDLSSLDAKPEVAPPPGGDNLGFAAFGRVVEGMAVVKAIQSASISPTAGEGPMKGQMLAAPVKLLKAGRVTWSPTPVSVPTFDPAVLPEP